MTWPSLVRETADLALGVVDDKSENTDCALAVYDCVRAQCIERGCIEDAHRAAMIAVITFVFGMGNDSHAAGATFRAWKGDRP